MPTEPENRLIGMSPANLEPGSQPEEMRPGPGIPASNLSIYNYYVTNPIPTNKKGEPIADRATLEALGEYLSAQQIIPLGGYAPKLGLGGREAVGQRFMSVLVKLWQASPELRANLPQPTRLRDRKDPEYVRAQQALMWNDDNRKRHIRSISIARRRQTGRALEDEAPKQVEEAIAPMQKPSAPIDNTVAFTGVLPTYAPVQPAKIRMGRTGYGAPKGISQPTYEFVNQVAQYITEHGLPTRLSGELIISQSSWEMIVKFFIEGDSLNAINLGVRNWNKKRDDILMLLKQLTGIFTPIFTLSPESTLQIEDALTQDFRGRRLERIGGPLPRHRTRRHKHVELPAPINALTDYGRDIEGLNQLSSPESLELIRKATDGDQRAVKEFILGNVDLVRAIAYNLRGKGVDLEDLIAEGNLALTVFVSTLRKNPTNATLEQLRQSIEIAMKTIISNQRERYGHLSIDSTGPGNETALKDRLADRGPGPEEQVIGYT